MPDKEKVKKENSQTTQNIHPLIQQNPLNSPMSNIIDKNTKIVSYMMHAHYFNSINSGFFNAELNKLYKANNFPAIVISED